MVRSRFTSVMAVQAIACLLMGLMPAQWTVAGSERDISTVLIGIPVSQAVLAALWLVMGTSTLVVRAALCSALLLMSLLGSYAFYVRHDSGNGAFLLLLLIGCLCGAWLQAVVVFGAVAKCLKLRLRKTDEPDVLTGLSQFHLWHLLVTVTVSAALLGTARLLVKDVAFWELGISSRVLWAVSLLVLLLVTFCALSALITFVAILGTRRYLLGGIVALMTITLLTWPEYWLYQLVDQPSAEFEATLVRNVVSFAWAAVCALILRTGGWRFRRQLTHA